MPSSQRSIPNMNVLKYLFCLAALSLLPLKTWSAVLDWDQTEVRVDLQPNEIEAKATYTVTNNSDTTLRIARVKASCGCTGSVVDRKILEPGQSSTIRATFNKGKRKGKNHSKLYVYLDNQPQAVATLHFIVTIPELIKHNPRSSTGTVAILKAPGAFKSRSTSNMSNHSLPFTTTKVYLQ